MAYIPLSLLFGYSDAVLRSVSDGICSDACGCHGELNANQMPRFDDAVQRSVGEKFCGDACACHEPVNVAQEATEEDDGTLLLEVAMPGMNKNNVEVEVSDGSMLTVKGHRTSFQSHFANQESVNKSNDPQKPSEDVRAVRTAEVKRSFKLDDDRDVSKLEARLQDGILYLVVPKSKPKLIQPKIVVQ